MSVPYDLTLKFSEMPEAADLMDGLAIDLRVSAPGAIMRGLALLRVVVDAAKAGNRLAVLSPDDDIIRDIINVIPAEE